MRREAERNASHQMHQVGDQRRVVRKMCVQMINPFAGAPMLPVQEVDQAHGLEKTSPAAAGGIAFIDASIDYDIKQRMEVSFEMQPGCFNILL